MTIPKNEGAPKQKEYFKRGNGTRTSSFGSPGRFGHDASEFYASRLYEGRNGYAKVKHIENPIPSMIINHVINKSFELMNY